MLFCFFFHRIDKSPVFHAHVAKKRKLVLPHTLSQCKYLMFGGYIHYYSFFSLVEVWEAKKWINKNKKKKKKYCGMQSIATFQLNRNRSIESMSMHCQLVTRNEVKSSFGNLFPRSQAKICVSQGNLYLDLFIERKREIKRKISVWRLNFIINSLVARTHSSN